MSSESVMCFNRNFFLILEFHDSFLGMCLIWSMTILSPGPYLNGRWQSCFFFGNICCLMLHPEWIKGMGEEIGRKTNKRARRWGSKALRMKYLIVLLVLTIFGIADSSRLLRQQLCNRCKREMVVYNSIRSNFIAFVTLQQQICRI